MGEAEERQKQEQKYIKMTTTPVEKLICSLAGPTIVSMLVTSFYNMADTFFVGKIGTSATGAVGIVFSVMAIIQAFGFFFGHGSGNYVSRKLGEKDFEEASRMAATGFVSAFLAGLVIMIVGLIFLEPLCYLLGATPTILPHAKSYLRIILIGAPYMTAALVLNNQLRFQGSAFYGMIGITSGAVLNIVLDPLFIYVFHMGVAGAALATIISQFVSFLLLLRGTGTGGNVHIDLRKFSPSIQRYKIIINGGSPSLCRQGLSSVSTACMNLMARPYGDAAIAAMSIVMRITNFAASIMTGFGQGFQPVCGFNYGARKFRRVQKGFWFCVRLSTVFLLGMAVLGWFGASGLVALFQREDQEVIAFGTRALRFQCISFPLLGWITMCNMMMQTIGKGVRASIMAMSRQGLFFIPLVIVLSSRIGFLGVQMSQPISDVLSFLVAIILQASVLREMNLQVKKEEAE
ncbi:MAG TPA: MATE family efflux transporter [Candidatus Enterocloster excrementigallinarum]|uniref:Multidrug export protein MepA n=1 Tax=Candidatus Enterocloster excrementigallinarum TaxID=2838558 RepID=A0A9D2PUG7_9FIRM|nr:MATE family efflux transporter [Candidatus Enterocloster excrementigallinarum]